MRATQFVRRGLVAFAAVATLSLGLSGVASAQQGGAFPENAPAPVAGNGTAVVFVPIPGFAYTIVGDNVAVLGVGVTGGLNPVAVEFLPDLGRAAIVTPGPTGDIILP